MVVYRYTYDMQTSGSNVYQFINEAALVNNLHARGVPNFKLMLLYVQAVITKGCPKFIIVEKCDRKKTAYM